jgi:hypothetical protein
MKTGQILAVITLLGLCSAQTDPYTLGGIPLSTPLPAFTAKYPSAICNGDPQFRSCKVDGLAMAGVRATRTDFNFASATLTSINVVFQPTPSDDQLNAMENELTRAYGQPAHREVSPSHQLHAAWENGQRRVLFNVGIDRTIIILETVQ